MPLIKKFLPPGRVRDKLERWHAVLKYGRRPEETDFLWPDEGSGRPRILVIADRPGWAFDTEARAVQRRLTDRFDIRVTYSAYRPRLDRWSFDLVYVFGFDEFSHVKYVRDPRRVIKELAHLPPPEENELGTTDLAKMVELVAWDAATITVYSRKLQKELAPYREALLVPQGVDTDVMKDYDRRRGPLKLGWVGSRDMARKGLTDILIPAARGFDLRLATGGLSLAELVNFYNDIDVICISSSVEGGPLPLLEGMATGCFPVTTDVGIVPELVRDGDNGVVVERTVAAFRCAFQWCAEHLDQVRAAGRRNHELIARTRSWDATAPAWAAVFNHALSGLSASEGRTGPPRRDHDRQS